MKYQMTKTLQTESTTAKFNRKQLIKQFNPSSTTTDETLYLRKQFFKSSGGISGSNTIVSKQ